MNYIDPEGLLASLANLSWPRLPWNYRETWKYKPDPRMTELTIKLRDAFREKFFNDALTVIGKEGKNGSKT